MNTVSEKDDARRLRDAIRGLVRRFSVSERADVSCCGMTVAQAATLESLSESGSMRSGELGRRLGIRPSTLTRNLRRLEQRGLVERAPDADDARAVVVRLTPDGRRAAAEVEQQQLRFARAILGLLPERTRGRTLSELVGLLKAIRAATETCCPGAYDHLWEG